MNSGDRPSLSASLPYWQDRDPTDALVVAEAAEKLGYHRIWVGEMATFDAFALATAIGLAPGRIPLCLGPLAVDVRSPATIAIGAASVAALTGRGVDVAIGSSSSVVVCASLWRTGGALGHPPCRQHGGQTRRRQHRRDGDRGRRLRRAATVRARGIRWLPAGHGDCRRIRRGRIPVLR